MYHDAFDVFAPDENQAEPSHSEDDMGNVSGNKTGFEFGPHPKFIRGDAKYALSEEFKMVEENRFICSMDLLLDVLSQRCQTPGCSNILNVVHHFIGKILIANISCHTRHVFRFCFSHEVNLKYANNIHIAAAMLLSGNNFGKVKRLAESINSAFISKSSSSRVQRVYVLPAVDE